MEEDTPVLHSNSLSWNTYLSRSMRSLPSLSRATVFSQSGREIHGLDDVIRAAKNLNLRRYHYEELVREEQLGEGGTYLVERCVRGADVFAVKHLKFDLHDNGHSLRSKLKSVVLEVQIMKHAPLEAHRNVTTSLGYGWNMHQSEVAPFILMEYASMGTLREYFRQRGTLQRQQFDLLSVGLLVGDVAAGLSALHQCGIIHGDVKLDNMLVFPDNTRPSGAVVKVGDFGHAIVVKDGSESNSRHLRYGGTSIYDAPEVQNQDTSPIERSNLWRCDVWAFGLLLWEACIFGLNYRSWIQDNRPDCHERSELLQMAKSSIPGARQALGPPMFIRMTLNKTLQEQADQRVAFNQLPIYTHWNAPPSAEANVPLQRDAPAPTYEVLRIDPNQQFTWEQEQQIFSELEMSQPSEPTLDGGSIAWQIGLYFDAGFGTQRNSRGAYYHASIAKQQGHPLAEIFMEVLADGIHPSRSIAETYTLKVSKLLRLTDAAEKMPVLIRACFNGDDSLVLRILSEGVNPSLPAADGSTLFHWLFMLKSPDVVLDMIELQDLAPELLTVDSPFVRTLDVHPQWPLQLTGSPLCVAISVNCLPAVKALLALGANPLAHAYFKDQYNEDDQRVHWTPIHIATQYQCPEILETLLETVPREKVIAAISDNPMAVALSFSTTLERRAMHGAESLENLNRTISIIQRFQTLATVAANGKSGLMQAIEFHDFDVVAALLKVEPKLCIIPFAVKHDRNLFKFPIHLASERAARRDTPDALCILQLLHKTEKTQFALVAPSLDGLKRTPLHMAVTGPSKLAAEWLLETEGDLLELRDGMGRTALQYCVSPPCLQLLLNYDADVNRADRFGMTALHSACLQGNLDLVRALVKSTDTLDIDSRPEANDYGSPLHCAVIGGSIEVLLSILDAGAQINLTDLQGNTAVMVAARLNRPAILRILMRYGADITLRNRNGRDAWEIATSSNQDVNEEFKRALWPLVKASMSDIAKIIVNDKDFNWHRDQHQKSPLPDENKQNGQNSAAKETEHQTQTRKFEAFHRLYSSLRRKHHPFADDQGTITGAFVNNILLYFQDGLWQGPASAKAWEIIVSNTFDLSKMLRFSSVLDIQKESFGITTTCLTAETRKYHAIAAACTAVTLEKARPAWVLPGRSIEQLQSLLLQELNRTYEPSWDEYFDMVGWKERSFNTIPPVLARYPELSRLDLTAGGYFQWKEARDLAKMQRIAAANTERVLRGMGKEQDQWIREANERDRRDDQHISHLKKHGVLPPTYPEPFVPGPTYPSYFMTF